MSGNDDEKVQNNEIKENIDTLALQIDDLQNWIEEIGFGTFRQGERCMVVLFTTLLSDARPSGPV